MFSFSFLGFGSTFIQPDKICSDDLSTIILPGPSMQFSPRSSISFNTDCLFSFVPISVINLLQPTGHVMHHQQFNPLNPELNPICYLLALLGAHHFLHVSRIRVKLLTLRRLMSYIYGAPILDVSRSHTTTQHSR